MTVSGGGTVEERLARALAAWGWVRGCTPKDVQRVLALAEVALYDPATHAAIPKVTRERLEWWIANAYIERSAEAADVADYVLNKLRGGSDGG